MSKKILFLISLILITSGTFSQPAEKSVKLIVAADHLDWTYKTGEPVKFNVSVLKNGNPIPNVKIRYEIGPEKQDPTRKDSMVLTNGTTVLPGGTMKNPGFLRCTVVALVDGKEYRSLSTAGIDPSAISPTIKDPADFDRFWDSAKLDLAKIPVDAKLTLIPERCTDKVNVYHVSMQNFRMGTRLYGILCMPKKPGKYPALLQVPGAGVRAYYGDVANAEKGLITFQIGIHGIPVTMDPLVYADLGSGVLNGYPNYNLDNRDRFFYKRVYLGCVRAVDFLASLPEYDGENLAVVGGSQGGALSIVTAALDNRVKWLGAYYPALCDLTGYLFNRAGGWPHYLDRNNREFNNSSEKLKTMEYYDVVNFARRVKIPGIYSWGFNDEVCPPTSIYAAYNVIPGEKNLFLALETGHWTFPEQTEKVNGWLISKLQHK